MEEKKPRNVGRPGKIEFKPGNKAIEGIMTLFNKYILSGQNEKTHEERMHYITLKSKKYGMNCELDGAYLSRWLFSAYERDMVVALSKEYCKRISNFLHAAKNDFAYERKTYLIDELDKYFELSDEEKESEDKNYYRELFPNSKEFLRHLNGSGWLVYERIGGREGKSDWGISRSEIIFRMNAHHMLVEMRAVLSKEERMYHGIATTDARSYYLYVDMVSSMDNNRRHNLVLKLGDSDIPSQSIMTGHYTYHSKTYKHLLSKSVIMVKAYRSRQERLQIEDKLLQPGHFLNNSKEFKQISLHIRQFLHNRERNRLSLPQTIINDEFDLKSFVAKSKIDKIDKDLKQFFSTEFYVYYNKSGRKLTEDTLSVKYNELAIKLSAEYKHMPEMGDKEPVNWSGNIYMSSRKRGVIIELNNNNDGGDPIFLTFLLPDSGVPYEDTECFPGIISGLEDRSKGPVSFICLVVRKDLTSFKRGDDKRILSFFNKQKSMILPSDTPRFLLNEL